ncbi:MAG: signal peptidase I [Chloroflexales bacterium]
MDETPLRPGFGADAPEPAPPDFPRTESSPWAPELEGTRPTEAPLRVRRVVRELLETALFILLVFFIVRGIVQNFKIEGSSMEPTLHTSQYILVNKLVYFHFDLNAPLRLLPGQEKLSQRIIYPFHQPQRGDIVVFEYPRDVSKDYIKRVIGLPGDQLEVRDGKVFINGTQIDQPFLQGASTFCLTGGACQSGPVHVPAGEIFVMGDNRGNSSDSREWGALPLDRVVGQAWVIYYPVADWGLVPHQAYPALPTVSSLQR